MAERNVPAAPANASSRRASSFSIATARRRSRRRTSPTRWTSARAISTTTSTTRTRSSSSCTRSFEAGVLPLYADRGDRHARRRRSLAVAPPAVRMDVEVPVSLSRSRPAHVAGREARRAVRRTAPEGRGDRDTVVPRHGASWRDARVGPGNRGAGAKRRARRGLLVRRTIGFAGRQPTRGRKAMPAVPRTRCWRSSDPISTATRAPISTGCAADYL